MSNMSRRKGARVENDIAHAIQRHCMGRGLALTALGDEQTTG
jgi:hypothetical protein